MLLVISYKKISYQKKVCIAPQCAINSPLLASSTQKGLILWQLPQGESCWWCIQDCSAYFSHFVKIIGPTISVYTEEESGPPSLNWSPVLIIWEIIENIS